MKEDIRDLPNALEKILNLRGVTYYWKNHASKGDVRNIGFIAQEVEKVVPELVLKDDKGFLGLNYSNFTPILVNSIQEFFKKWRSDSAQIHAELQNLKAKNEKLEKENLDKDLEIKKLKKQSAETNARLDKIESLLKHK